MENQGKGMAIASLVLGIIAVIIALFFGPFAWIGIITGVVGLVLAILAKKKGQKGAATAGLVLSIIGLAISAIIFIACVACVSAAESALDSELQNALNDLSSQLENLTY